MSVSNETFASRLYPGFAVHRPIGSARRKRQTGVGDGQRVQPVNLIVDFGFDGPLNRRGIGREVQRFIEHLPVGADGPLNKPGRNILSSTNQQRRPLRRFQCFLHKICWGIEGANVSVQTLTATDDGPQQTTGSPTTKADIVKALEAAQSLRPQDTVVLYLSGHGINYGGQDGDFYCLTTGATSADAAYLNDPAIRQTYALSSEELTRYLNLIPARKKLLILDVCAAGEGAEQLLIAARDLPASQIRALARLQSRTGFYVLAGSAADAVSYESNVYGQGLLTYALLQGMRGGKLRRERAGNKFIQPILCSTPHRLATGTKPFSDSEREAFSKSIGVSDTVGAYPPRTRCK